MINFLKTYFVLSFLIVSGIVNASLTNEMFDIRHIGYPDGISSQRVFSIVEDSDNAIWIATKMGVDRYNGNIIKNYILSGDFNYGDMAGRTIRLIYDKRCGLWAYDNTGKIYLYSPQNDCFEPRINLSEYIDNEIILNKIVIDDSGLLWFCMNEGLYSSGPDKSISQVVGNRYINDICGVGDNLFVATSSGILLISKHSKQTLKVMLDGQYIQSVQADSINNELWVGSFNNGMFAIDLEKYDVTPIRSGSSNFFKPIRDITEYDSCTMLAGVDGGGVYAIDKRGKEACLLMNSEDDNDIFLKGNGIYAVTADSQKNIWIGSYTGGVSMAILQKYPIKYLKHERGNSQSLVDNNINDIEENKSGDLLFATDRGISVCKYSSNRWEHWLKGSVIVTLCRNRDGCVWAGTYGDGVYLLDAEGRVRRHLTKQNGDLTTNYVFSIKQDSDGDLWIGGLEGELLMLSGDGKSKCSYDIKWIQSVEIVDNDHIAIATVKGFSIINKRTGEIKNYITPDDYRQKNTSAYIVSMLFNKDTPTVWLGTEGGGVNLYNMQTSEIIRFTTNEGMPSNDIYSLQRDSKGRIWASTGKGLALIDNMKVSSLNYLVNLDNEYNKSSSAHLRNGMFAYGSTNGVVIINPDAINVTDYKAPLRFTGLTLSNLSNDQQKVYRPIVYGMLKSGVVDLSYSLSSFEVAFESINYHFQGDIFYQYILEGYDKFMSEPSSNGTVRYTNVAPGCYKLIVNSLRRSDGKVISECSIDINVAHPWWNSWYAWLAYCMILSAIFYFIFRLKSNELQKKHDEDKLRFFVNTAHDIRTPVSLIMAPLEDLSRVEGLSADATTLLNLARKNTSKLNVVLTQLLEFEKVDSRNRQYNFSSLCINDILIEVASSFQMLCDKKQLELNLSLPENDLYTIADRYVVEMLLDNLISNACKYTLPNGKIDLCLSGSGNKIILEVRDTGIGIPENARKYIFTDVYRADNVKESHESGTGFGLLQVQRIVKMLHGGIRFDSELNKGSTFTVTLKRTDKLPEEYSPDIVSAAVMPQTFTLDDGNEPISDTKSRRDTILIVEDHDVLRSYLRRIFANSYNVVDVANGDEALRYLSEEYPDIILSDLMMPGIQGDELCRRVKDSPLTSGIPFILLTAKTNHDAEVDGLRNGADDYISKPFSSEILKLKVQGFINSRNNQRTHFMRQALLQVENSRDAEGGENDVLSEDLVEKTSTGDIMSENDRLFVVRVTQIVLDNIDNTEFSITSLCQEMAMSRTLFYSRLKSLTGNAPQEFIRIIRLQKASELLKSGMSVTDVAMYTGFVNVKYFSSLFKKQFGIQPSKYEHTEMSI